MYSVAREAPYSFWIEADDGEVIDEEFRDRGMAERLCVILNRYESQRIEAKLEPIRITLDTTPIAKPGAVKASIPKPSKVVLGSYAKPKDKTLTIAVKDEKPAPKPEKIKITLP